MFSEKWSKNEAFLEWYVCISSRGPLPPLDLELYPRASQASHELAAAHAAERATAPEGIDSAPSSRQRERSAKIKLKIKKTCFEN